jgi:hypothetical protein
MTTHHKPGDLLTSQDSTGPVPQWQAVAGSLLPDLSGAAAAAAKPATTTTPSTTLYEVIPGATSSICIADLHQDGLGDCFLISSIGELALTDPAAIQNMIKLNSNGTETVTLYEEASGKLPVPGYVGAYKPVQETVTNTFDPNSVNSGSTQDVLNGVKEIWPQVIEKAVAQLNGGYSAIASGGYPFIAQEELTGVQASWLYLPQQSLTLTALAGYVKAGDMINFDTVGNPNGYGLYGGHSYMFEGLNTANGGSVTLGNPWGVDQPTGAIPLSQLNKYFVQVDIGHHG